MKYSTISLDLWTPEFRDLSLEAKVIWLHMKAYPPMNSEGLYRWPPGHVMADNGLEQGAYEKARAELIDAGYISYDPKTEVVLDRHSLRVTPPRGWPQLRGALRALESVPSTPLLQELLELAREHAPEFAKLLVGEYEHDVTNPKTGEIRTIKEPGLSTLSIPPPYPIDTTEWSGVELSRAETAARERVRAEKRAESRVEPEANGSGEKLESKSLFPYTDEAVGYKDPYGSAYAEDSP